MFHKSEQHINKGYILFFAINIEIAYRSLISPAIFCFLSILFFFFSRISSFNILASFLARFIRHIWHTISDKQRRKKGFICRSMNPDPARIVVELQGGGRHGDDPGPLIGDNARPHEGVPLIFFSGLCRNFPISQLLFSFTIFRTRF